VGGRIKGCAGAQSWRLNVLNTAVLRTLFIKAGGIESILGGFSLRTERRITSDGEKAQRASQNHHNARAV
jgi:hypothetical protein